VVLKTFDTLFHLDALNQHGVPWLSKHKRDQSTSTQKAHYKTLSSTIQNLYLLEKSKEKKKDKSNKSCASVLLDCSAEVLLQGGI